MVFMRIAIVKLSALGDIIHGMTVLQFIKQNNNKINIDWIVEEKFKELLMSIFKEFDVILVYRR